MADHWIQFGMLFLTLMGVLIMNRIDASSINKEMKDFHGRLCALEEKYIQMMERILEKKDNK